MDNWARPILNMFIVIIIIGIVIADVDIIIINSTNAFEIRGSMLGKEVQYCTFALAMFSKHSTKYS